MRLLSLLILAVSTLCPATSNAQCDPNTGSQDFSLLGDGQAGALNQPDPVVVSFDSSASGSDPAASTAFLLDTGVAHNSQATVSVDLATGKLAYFMTSVPLASDGSSIGGASGSFVDRVCFDLPDNTPTADIDVVLNVKGSIVCDQGGDACQMPGTFPTSLAFGAEPTAIVPFADLTLLADQTSIDHQIVISTTVEESVTYEIQASTSMGTWNGGVVDFSNTIELQFVLPDGVSFESASGVLLTTTGGSGTAGDTQRLDSNPFASRNFGYSVAISGDTAVVGAPYENSDSIFVFTGSNGVWTQQAMHTGGPGFGYAVAVDGDTLVVGAPQDCQFEDAVERCGFAYVYTRSNGAWTEQARLAPSDAYDSGLVNNFGGSVALDGDTIIVGLDADGAADIVSSVYVFTRSNDVWTEQAKLTAGDAVLNDLFGISAALDGDTAVIGAPGDDDGADDSGSAFVFTRDGSAWTEQTRLAAGDAESGDSFGYSVALDGGTAVIGAFRDDDTVGDSGSAYVFTGGGATWTQQEKLTASDAGIEDFFGFSVSVRGDTALIGAFQDDDSGNSSGSAYVFSRSGGIWAQREKLTASDAASFDSFGRSVSIDGDTALTGAHRNVPSGSAYLFSPVPDPDDDGDGVLFDVDFCPGTDASNPVDLNGCSDAQVDGDDDGYCDPSAPSTGPSGCAGIDAFPGDANEWSDNDGDGIGDNADLDDDNDNITDTLDTDPLGGSNGCTGGDRDNATLAIPVDSDLTCAARVSIAVEGATQVTDPDGDLTLIAPVVSFQSGMSVAGKLTVLNADSCPGCVAPPPAFAIGDTGPAGGIVFYVTDGGTHGMEAAPEDQGNVKWGCAGTLLAGADGTEVGTGAQNTADILAGCQEEGTAAQIADSYTLNGFDDWFLPSQDELILMYLNIGQGAPGNIGDFEFNYYWSSSEKNAFDARKYNFEVGYNGIVGKQYINWFRSVRAF